jgi:transcriptional regulator with XRE-family HTH domain
MRIDRGLLLKNMADAIGVSSAFLSAVETGRKQAPGDLVEKICSAYHLDLEKSLELKKAYEETIKEIRIDLTNLTTESRGLALAFAKRFGTLNDREQSRLFSILSGRGSDV